MRIGIELKEEEIRNIIAAYLNNEYSLSISGSDLKIKVKSKQNYKSEWEEANIKIEQDITQKPR